ncbi:MAG: PH domain-containing protein [Gaiellales bacterium]
MSSIDRLLAPSERVYLVTREHGVVLAPAFLRAAAGLGVLGVIAYVAAGARPLGPVRTGAAALAGLLAVVVMMRLLRSVVAWHTRHLVVTDRRAMLVSGGLSRRVAVMPLDTVDGVEVRASGLGRLLRYGGLVVSTRGHRGVLFGLRRLPDPDLVFGLVLGLDERITARTRRIAQPRPAGAAPAGGR